MIQGFFIGGRAHPAPGIARAALQRQPSAARPLPGPPPAVHAGHAAPLQRLGAGDGFEVDAIRLGLVRSGGSQLPATLLAKMEAAFGTDFSAVRIHVGPQAARIGAVAFTTGNDVYFAPGRYQPESVQGQQLIGHELAHVVQQRQGRVRASGNGLAVVQDRALEAEADRLGMRAALHRAPLQHKAAHGAARPPAAPRAVQRYVVLGQDKIYGAMPNSRPWFGYPYAVVPRADAFSAQQRAGSDPAAEFLHARRGALDRNRLHQVDLGHRGASLRVSNDSRMAIEDSDLNSRQPKVFYATAGVIAAANQARHAQSKVRLVQGGDTIVILTGWYSHETLHRVTPQFDVDPAQNCDALAGQVTGAGGFIVGRGDGMAEDSIVALLGLAGHRDLNLGSDAHAAAYVREQGRRAGDIATLGLNASARPGVGHAFMIRTNGANRTPDAPQSSVLDVASGQVRVLNWGFHFGAVVAQSGSDRVTLENYARGDDRGRNDPRWYFQMYGEGAGQSFHEFHTARREYSNPVTVSTEQRAVPRLRRGWNLW